MISDDTTTAASTISMGVQLRKRSRMTTPEQPSESEMLRAIREELRMLHEKRERQQQREAEYQALLRLRDEVLQRLEEHLTQLSPSDNISPSDRNFLIERSRFELGYK